MSTDIVFERAAFACPGVDGEILYLLTAEMGCNNVRKDRGRIARSWDAIAFGNYRVVLSRITELAASCESGCLQHGSRLSDTRRSVTAEGFIRAWLPVLHEAQMLSVTMPTAVITKHNRWEPEPSPQSLKNFECAASLARQYGGTIEGNSVEWDLKNPRDASTYAIYRRLSERKWPSEEVPGLRFAPRVQHPLDDPLSKLLDTTPPVLGGDELLLVKKMSKEWDDAKYLLLGNERSLLNGYEARQRIVRRAVNAVLTGVDPIRFIRAGKKALSEIPLSTGTVKFVVRGGYTLPDAEWQLKHYGQFIAVGDTTTWSLEHAATSYLIDWSARTTVTHSKTQGSEGVAPAENGQLELLS